MEHHANIILFYLTVACLLVLATGSPFRQQRGRRYPPGKPDDMTLDEFLETRGQGRQKQVNIRRLAKNIRRRLLKPGQTLPGNMDDKFDDLVFTEEQLQIIEQMLSSRNDDVRRPNRRHKRKVANFANPSAPFKKWTTTTIYYLLDGTQTVSEQADIRAAMDHWAEQTCIRFVEAPRNMADVPYIYVTKNDSDGCWSYIGRVTDAGPQILNLASECFSNDGQYGTIVHELGHAVGFVHEHTRDDRDTYVTINEANILSGLESQFTLWQTGWLNLDIQTKAIYDLSSVMHYSPKTFSSNNDYTITANDPLYAGNMGQRRYLTFWDAYAANLEYCSDVCTSQVLCQKDGYQDPNSCDTCICPDGFTGQFCDQDKANTAVCPNSGHLDLGVDPVCIDIRLSSTSRGTLECNWHIQAAGGCTIDFWFESVNLACSTVDKSCYDYVEVKYKSDLAVRGPRFCCTTVPDAINGTLGKYQTSASNEMVVNLGSFYTVQGYMPSFKLCLKLSNADCATTSTTTTTTTTSTTTTTTPTTTTSTPTTLTTTSTTPTATSTTTTPKSTTTSTTSTTTATTPTTTTTTTKPITTLTTTATAPNTTLTTKPTTTSTTSTTTATTTAATLTSDKTTTKPTITTSGTAPTTIPSRRPHTRPNTNKPRRHSFWWSRWQKSDEDDRSDSVAGRYGRRKFGRDDSRSESYDRDIKGRTRGR